MIIPLMEKKEYFHRTSLFPPSHHLLILIKPYCWPFCLKKKKAICLCTYTTTSCPIKEQGRGKWTEKTVCSSQDVVGPKCGFLTETVFSGGAEFWSEEFLLVDTCCLLLEHVNCVFLLHFQLCWRICFLEWVPIKSESDPPLWQTLSFTVVFH